MGSTGADLPNVVTQGILALAFKKPNLRWFLPRNGVKMAVCGANSAGDPIPSVFSRIPTRAISPGRCRRRAPYQAAPIGHWMPDNRGHRRTNFN